MKNIIIILVLALNLQLISEEIAIHDLIVYENEYNIVPLGKGIKKVIVGNKNLINTSLMKGEDKENLLKIFGREVGSTSILLVYKSGFMETLHVFINKNLRYIQKMVNIVEPNIHLSKVGDGATIITGSFTDPHNKNRVYKLLKSAGINLESVMDLTHTHKVNKMVRTKLYLVEINNQRAKDLGGITGLGFLNKSAAIAVNPAAANAATFSGWLLDSFGEFTSATGRSITGMLNFLEEKGVGKVLDDTVLITTEDKNASFRVGGEVYIPVGMTQNTGTAPTVNLKEREYGLTLSLNTKFMQQPGYMYIEVDIEDSAFDTNVQHNVNLGEGISVPGFVSKNIKTNVVVRSGQVIALGGRLHTEDIDNEEKIPLLGDIPILGELFKHTVSHVNGNDLLFFLVPEFVDANENIDDRKFYRDMVQTGTAMHKTILDMHKPKVTGKTQKPKKVSEVTVPDIHVETVKIEEEVIRSRNSIKTEHEVVSVEPKVQISSSTQESNTAKHGTNYINSLESYEVSARRMYIRDGASLSSNKVAIWKRGHPFKASEVRENEEIEWLKIEEDCLDGCKMLEIPLWISKKYTYHK